MAWRSSGTSNDEMVANLKRFGVISSASVERGVRHVDRKYFVPQEREDQAHSDQPLREGNVHISAPHMYGAALEALELHENSSQSFLNVGSGTGYLNCIVATILGPYSTNYGVEIHKDVLDHCEASIARWKAGFKGKLPYMQLIHGNALHISMSEGEALVGFDRIYVGASISRSNLSLFTSLLKEGGILVGPVGDELVKVVRKPQKVKEDQGAEFSIQVLSGVRFSSLLTHPVNIAVLPSRVWSPSVHQAYPKSFRESSMALMMCSRSSYVQSIVPARSEVEYINLAATLPNVIWMEILSYTHHNWFDPPLDEDHYTTVHHRLLEHEKNAREAHAARRAAEERCQMAERERDIYRLLARRWQVRLHSVLIRRHRTTTITEEHSSSQESSILGLIMGSRGSSRSGREDDHDDDDDDESYDDDNQSGDHDDEEEERFMDVDEYHLEEHDGEEEDFFDGNVDMDSFTFSLRDNCDEIPLLEESETSISNSLSSSPPAVNQLMMARSQVRTVSIADEA